jgi:hypothetical protein
MAWKGGFSCQLSTLAISSNLSPGWVWIAKTGIPKAPGRSYIVFCNLNPTYYWR